MSELKGIAFVTGSASGIGRAIASKLAEDGFDVALFDLPSSHDTLKSVAEEIERKSGRRTLKLLGDVSVEDDVQRGVETVAREWGGLDVMVANAGISLNRALHEFTVDDFDRLFAVNVRGTFLCYKYAAVQMMKQGRGGRIIGASSIAGKKGMPENSVYSSTKFAIRGLTQSAGDADGYLHANTDADRDLIAMEYGKYGITVNAYAPGIIETPLLAKLDEWHAEREGKPKGAWTQSLNSANVLGRNGHPEDVVGVVSFLASKNAEFITGQTISVDGGIVYD